MKLIVSCFVSALGFAAALASLLIMPDIGEVCGMPIIIIIAAVFFAAQLTCCFTVRNTLRKFIPTFISVIPLTVVILLYVGIISSGSAIADIIVIKLLFSLIAAASIGSTASWFTYSLIRADRWK